VLSLFDALHQGRVPNSDGSIATSGAKELAVVELKMIELS
tara:strand:- start:549 stop:668 length:120 start_codon:yes stop_codon:yes gene_type:complete